MFLTTWVFQFLWQILVILLVVLFQSEIRQALEKVNPLQKLGFRKQKQSEEWVVEFAKGVFLLAGQQDFEVKLQIPFRTKGLPSQMEILEPLNANIQVTLRGLRRDASILDKEKVVAEVDLSRARPGKMDFAITRNEIRLSDDRVKLVNVHPSRLVFGSRLS